MAIQGGSTRIPAVQDAVEKFFGKKPSKGVNPDEAAWAAAAAETRAAPVLDVVDYESMETADLKALCKERGIRPLPVRRLVIEDLRFYDAHGVAGVRHPATKQLSLPKKKK